LKGESEIKLSVKLTLSEKISVLDTFLKSPLNFLSNDLKNTTRFDTVREKSGFKV